MEQELSKTYKWSEWEASVSRRVPVHTPVSLGSWGPQHKFTAPPTLPIALRPMLEDENVRAFVQASVSASSSTSLEPVFSVLEGLEDTKLRKVLENAKFVSFRNNLNKMAATDRAFSVRVEVWRGIRVLDIVSTADAEEQETEESSMGRVWERLCVEDGFKSVAESGEWRLDAVEQHCEVLAIRVCNEHMVVMGAEMDAVDSQGRPIEIKCWRVPNGPGGGSNGLRGMHPQKLRKAWVQCFLAHVPTLFVGLRTQDGMVVDMVDEDVLDMPERYRFDGHDAMRKVAAWLTLLYHACAREGTLYHVDFVPGRTPADSRITVRVQAQADPSTTHIVPRSFVARVANLYSA